jgi:hypothetical protein
MVQFTPKKRLSSFAVNMDFQSSSKLLTAAVDEECVL